MSYDIYFLQAEDCANAGDFLEQLEDEEPSNAPASVARKEAVVEALRRIDPSLEPFAFDYEEIAKSLAISVEEARHTYNHVELNGPGNSNGVQITVHDRYVSLTVAYWHGGSEAERIFSTVERYASEIVSAGQYRIYDPQLERVVDRLEEIRSDVLRAYGGVIQRIPGLIAQQKAKPWWKFW